MVGSKVFITYAKPLPLTTEQRLRTFVEDHHPATIACVRSGDGVLTVIEAATLEQTKKVEAALVSSSLNIDPLDVVLGDSPEGRHLAQLYTELKQRELEINWTTAMVTTAIHFLPLASCAFHRLLLNLWNYHRPDNTA